jgi:WD40 repeat protein
VIAPFIPLLIGATLVSAVAQRAFGITYLAPAARTAIAQNLPHQLTAQSSQEHNSATELKGFNGRIISLAISPDGQVFVAAEETDIGVFSLSDGNRQMTLRGHAGKVSALAISPDSKTLVSTSAGDQTIRVWNLENGNLIKTIGEDIGPVTAVTFSPDGQYFVTGWSTKGSSLDINAIAISPDSRQVATANKEGTIMLFDIGSGKLVETLSAQKGRVLAVAFSPDGKYLYGGGEDKTIKIWELSK